MKIIIIGGAGFIGINTAQYFLKKRDENHEVVIYDNCSRPGSRDNIDWLCSNYQVKYVPGDIRNYDNMESLLNEHRDTDVIIHLAAQVAVTTSVNNPRMDYETNLSGTFNILEALRNNNMAPFLIYSSTNKVYGALESIPIEETETRYKFTDLPGGITEKVNLDMYSPYGCSKGAADQYVRDYNRIYDIPTVVFRQSCIYGPHQYGIEDQGWVAWFIIATLLEKKVTVFGTGKQVRDILYVSDLIKAYDQAIKNKDKCRGRIFNIGGGSDNSLSILEFFSTVENITGKKVQFTHEDWRPGDQKIFISNNSSLLNETGWFPQTSCEKGIKQTVKWIRDHLSSIRTYFSE